MCILLEVTHINGDKALRQPGFDHEELESIWRRNANLQCLDECSDKGRKSHRIDDI